MGRLRLAQLTNKRWMSLEPSNLQKNSRYSSPLVAEEPILSVTKTSSGILLGTADCHGPLSHLSLVLPVGSRFQQANEAGIAHLLKGYAFKSNSIESQLALTRKAELRYSPLSAKLTRDNLIISADFFRQQLPEIMELFYGIAENTKFSLNELEDVQEALEFDFEQSQQRSSFLLHDALYRVAFRQSPLGNPLLANPKIDLDDCKQSLLEKLRKFKQRCLAANNSAIVGINVAQQEIRGLESQLFGPKWSAKISEFQNQDSSTAIQQSVYYGGEERLCASIDSLNHFMVAFRAPGYLQPGFVATQVLLHAFGGGVNVKYGNGCSRFSQIGLKNGCSVHTFLNAHADHSLFGFHFAIPSGADVSPPLKAVYSAFINADDSFSSADMQLGASGAAFCHADLMSGSRSEWCNHMANHIHSLSRWIKAQEYCDLVNSLTLSQIKQVLKEIVASKPSVVSLGNQREIPYFDSI